MTSERIDPSQSSAIATEQEEKKKYLKFKQEGKTIFTLSYDPQLESYVLYFPGIEDLLPKETRDQRFVMRQVEGEVIYLGTTDAAEAEMAFHAVGAQLHDGKPLVKVYTDLAKNIAYPLE